LTTHTNLWNVIYKIEANKTRGNHALTTLKKADGTTTTDLEETIKMMADHLIHKDDATDDTEKHKKNTTASGRKHTNKRRQRIHNRGDKERHRRTKTEKAQEKTPTQQKYTREYINNFRQQSTQYITNA
jgi:hypothetical protein